MRSSASRRSPSKATRIVQYLLLIGVSLLALAPTAWMLSTSFKARGEVFEQAIRWIPQRFTFSNYIRAFSSLPLLAWMNNSIVIALLTLLVTVVIDVMIAYALSRMEFKGRNLIYAVIIATIMVPPHSTAIPMFKLIRWAGLIDSKIGIALPQAADAIGVFLLCQFFRGIPKELTEAASMDGASHWRILWRVIVPLAWPALTVLAILTLSNSWNNFFWPLVVAQSNASVTLPVGLSSLMSGVSEAAESREYGLLMATSVISCLPTVLAFLLLQRKFIEGITFTGLKG